MQTYQKINTLYKRDSKGRLIIGDFARPEIPLIGEWVAEEKIDGTNTRLHFSHTGLKIGGRTDNAQFNPVVLEMLTDLAHDLDEKVVDWILAEYDLDSITLVGETYGPKIQNGGDYSDEHKFVLFDVLLSDGRYLKIDDVTATADRLGLDRVPILYDKIKLETAQGIAINGFYSKLAMLNGKKRKAEGFVLKTQVPLYDQRGSRVVVKVKSKDYNG